jgi:major membrane immunogen (membrane-anchored lipoprotein)
MFQNKAVRSALVLAAFSGMLAACSSNSGSGEQIAPLAPAAGSILSQSEVQTAEVKIASVTDAEGHAVAMDTSAVLTQLAAVKRATVTREAYQGDDGAAAERMVIDLGDENGSIVRFQSAVDFGNITVATGGFPASAASATTEEGRITEMLITVEDGRQLNVVLTFIEPAGDDSKQDAKQDEPKKDEPKQDEPKQDEPKKDEPKKDEPKKDEPKQDEPKQDQPKKDDKKG